ncbi:MAG: hypothetical protein LR008_03055 [Candidatus Pacebacteria bacterium]|nr:hypothetical protein [Candidatus Paceibacterota bacterium]
MKKLSKKLVAFVCLLVMTASAYAVEPQRLWLNATGKNFSSTISALQTSGWADKEKILNIGLAKYAYDYALANNLIRFAAKSNQTEKGWIEYFRRYNNMSSEYTTIAEFKRKGQAKNGGYWIPIEQKYLNANAIAMDGLAKFLAKFKSVSKQVDSNSSTMSSLSKELSDLSKSINSLQGENTNLKTTVVSLQESLDAFENGRLTDSMLSAIDSQVKQQLIEISGLAKNVKNSVSSLEQVDIYHSEQISSIVSEVNYIKYALIALSLLVAGVILLTWYKHKLARKMTKRIDSLSSETDSCLKAVASLKDDNRFLKQEAGKYIFDENLVSKSNLEKLEIGGSAVDLSLDSTDETRNSISLEVRRTGSNQVTIWGAYRDIYQQTPLVVDSLDKVANKIYRAGARNCLEGIDKVQKVMAEAIQSAA